MIDPAHRSLRKPFADESALALAFAAMSPSRHGRGVLLARRPR